MAKEPHTSNSQNEEKKKKRTPWAAILVPLIFAGIVGAGYFAYQNDAFEKAGFDFFDLGDHKKTSPTDDLKPSDDEMTHSDTAEEFGADLDNSVDADDELVASEEEREVGKSAETSEAGTGTFDQDIPAGYHIVVGSFQNRSNAETYINELQSRGYNAYLAEGSGSYNRVAIGKFDSWRKAKNALDGVRQNVNTGSWIYSN